MVRARQGGAGELDVTSVGQDCWRGVNNTKRALVALVVCGAALTMSGVANATDEPTATPEGDQPGYVCIRVPNGNGGSYRVCGPRDNLGEYLTPGNDREG